MDRDFVNPCRLCGVAGDNKKQVKGGSLEMLRAFRHFRPAAAGRRLFMDYTEFRESIKQKVRRSCKLSTCIRSCAKTACSSNEDNPVHYAQSPMNANGNRSVGSRPG